MRVALFAVALALFMTGCAPTVPREPGPPRPEPRPFPEPYPGVPSPQPPAQIPAPAEYPRSAAEISGPAVLALLGQAETEAAAGRPEGTLAALERALRIEPRNPFVWVTLADAHLQRGDAEQAEAVARRAVGNARGNPYVESQAWRVIADAREVLGDNVGAQLARQRVDEIERTLRWQ